LFSCFLVSLLLVGRASADEFKLTSGVTIVGEAVLATANDMGLQIKVGEGEYKKVSWGDFSQEDLKKLAKNAKIEPFVQPFIEVDPQEKIKKKEFNLKEPPKVPLATRQSLLGAMFSSGLGLFMVLMLYAANIYAAYEVSIFRARPVALVCGLAAVPLLGLASPIVFLSLPTQVGASDQPANVPAEVAADGTAPAEGAEGDVNPMHADGAQHPTGLKLAHTEADASKSAVPEAVVFQRGQYTFNRRFIETKFAGFFSVVRRDADKDMLLVIKSARGEYAGQRISRIAANDLHLQVQRGHATEEVLIPFQEIQEIRLKHKDA
jgi:hypothetical protein